MNNSLFTIFPYLYMGTWVFDDASVGLVKEPFVAGADTLLSMIAGEGVDKITVVFSPSWFPDHQVVVDKMTDEDREKYGVANEHHLTNWGTYYLEKTRDHKLWLCPALNLYLPVSPDQIFFKVMVRE